MAKSFLGRRSAIALLLLISASYVSAKKEPTLTKAQIFAAIKNPRAERMVPKVTDAQPAINVNMKLSAALANIGGRNLEQTLDQKKQMIRDLRASRRVKGVRGWV